MMKKTFSMLVLALVGGYAVLGQTKKIEFTEYDLENGLHVILHQDNTLPIVAVSVLYHVGSKNEKPTRTGFAHFFEHLLFEGSDNVDRGEFTQYVANAGGVSNAFTNDDFTFYYEIFPSNQLEVGLWLESERMMHAKVDSIGVEVQREVVKEEKRQRIDNQPYGSVFLETRKRAYKVHPYRWTTIGSMKHLDQAALEEFIAFYRTYYTPDNAILSIAGDIDIAATKATVANYFQDIKRGSKPISRPTVVEPPQTHEIRDTVYDNIQVPVVIQSYHIPAIASKDSYALRILSMLLSGGKSSRMSKSLVDKQQIAVAVNSFPSFKEDPGLYMVQAYANVGVNVPIVERGVNEEIRKVQQELVSEREFQKVRNQIESDFVQGYTSMLGVARELAKYHMYYGNTSLVNTEMNQFMAVTREDLKRVANKYLTPENRVVLYYLPKLDEGDKSDEKNVSN